MNFSFPWSFPGARPCPASRGCRLALFLIVWSASLILTAPAAISFLFDYGTETNGFNGPLVGAQRRAALEDAAATPGSWFNHDTTIQISAQSFHDSGDQTLAYAGSNFAVTSGFRGYLQGIVGQKILSNGAVDGNGISADGQLTVNFGHSWDLGDAVDPGSFDFKATVMHEMLHAIGFASGINADGSDIWGAETPTESMPGGGSHGGIWAPFDDYLIDVSGTSMIDVSGTSIIDDDDHSRVGPGPTVAFSLTGKTPGRRTKVKPCLSTLPSPSPRGAASVISTPRSPSFEAAS